MENLYPLAETEEKPAGKGRKRIPGAVRAVLGAVLAAGWFFALFCLQAWVCIAFVLCFPFIAAGRRLRRRKQS